MKQSSRPESSAPTTVHPTLRKLVRSKLTKKFLSHKGAWVKDAVDAAAFLIRPHARAAIAVLGLDPLDLEFYFFFGHRKSRRRDFTVPLL